MSLQVAPSGVGSPALAYADTEPVGVPTVSDPATALLALILKSQGVQSDAALKDVRGTNELIEQTRREIQDAMKRTAEADKHSGFWDKVSKVFSGDIGALCEVVAAVAVTAATGGVGAPALLAMAAAGLSVGCDIAQRAGADPKLCAALSLAGAAAGFAVGDIGAGAGFWAGVAKGAALTHAAADGFGTSATVVSQNYHADSLVAQADTTGARGQQTAAVFDYNLALDALDRAVRGSSRAESTASNIVQSENDGRTALIARMGTV